MRKPSAKGRAPKAQGKRSTEAQGDRRAKSAGRALRAVLWLGVLLFTLGMLAAGWPRYWAYVAAETTPQAWLESVLLTLAAAVAALNAFAAVVEGGGSRRFRGVGGENAEPEEERRVRGSGPLGENVEAEEDRRSRGGRDGRRAERALARARRKGSGGAKALSNLLSRHEAWGWSATASAFAWLALDERFAVHERLRDRYLKQTGIRLLPWMEAGDWLIPLYAVCGLAFVWVLWRLLGEARTPRLYFAAALALAFCAVSLDTIDIRSLSKGSERLLQTIEECLETAAMTAFVSAFLAVLTGRLSAWYNRASIRREDRD